MKLKITIIVLAIAFSAISFAEDNIKSETIRVVTAYNAGDVRQCDADPCIDASNKNICEALEQGENRCAANFVPLGTFIHIDGFGYCKVTDRTNRRYKNRVDIAMKKNEYKKAMKWGKRKLLVKILED